MIVVFAITSQDFTTNVMSVADPGFPVGDDDLERGAHYWWGYVLKNLNVKMKESLDTSRERMLAMPPWIR